MPTTPADFDEFVEWFAARHLRKRGVQASPATVRTKRIYLSIAATAAGADTPRELCELLMDRDRIELLLDQLSATHQPASIRQALYALKPFGEYGKLKGWIPASLLLPSDFPSAGPGKPIVVYTQPEMELFVSAARGHSLRWWALLAFLADTGRRVGEALKLEWDWYCPDGRTPYFELPRSKNGDAQYIPITARLKNEVFTADNIARLRSVEKGRYKMFARSPQLHPFPWAYSTAHGIFGRFCEATGLPNRGFHNFRHTVITDRIARGVPIQAVAALAGHRTPAITMKRYAHATALDYARYLDGGTGERG